MTSPRARAWWTTPACAIRDRRHGGPRTTRAGIGADLDPEIGPLDGGAQISDRSTAPALVAHRHLQRTDTVLFGPVEITVAGIASLDRGGDKGVVQFVLGAQIGDIERAARTVMVVGPALLVFGAAEIGEHVVIRPSGIAELAPPVEILALAADVDEPVDRARPAQDLAARPGQSTAAQLGLRLRLELPGDLRVVDVAVEAGRDVDPRVRILAAGFEQQTRVFASALKRFARTHPAEPAPTTM